jgi:hypothetical protein
MSKPVAKIIKDALKIDILPLHECGGFLLWHTMFCVLNFGGFLLLTTLLLTTLLHGSLHRRYGHVLP